MISSPALGVPLLEDDPPPPQAVITRASARREAPRTRALPTFLTLSSSLPEGVSVGAAASSLSDDADAAERTQTPPPRYIHGIRTLGRRDCGVKPPRPTGPGTVRLVGVIMEPGRPRAEGGLKLGPPRRAKDQKGTR